MAEATVPVLELALAECVARRAHVGQVDKAGAPYIHHVARVAASVDGEDAQAVAWLHDVLEDTPVTAATLLGVGFSVPVVRAVEILTRRPEIPYTDYIAAVVVSRDEVAIAVKRADLQDHLREGCPPALRSRYVTALFDLESVFYGL